MHLNDDTASLVNEIFADISTNYHKLLNETDEDVVTGTTNGLDWKLDKRTGTVAVGLPGSTDDITPEDLAEAQNPRDYLLGTYFVRALSQLISKGLYIAFASLADGGAKFLFQVEGQDSKELFLTGEVANELATNPMSEKSLEVLEMVAQDLNVTMEDIELIEEYNALRTAIGDC